MADRNGRQLGYAVLAARGAAAGWNRILSTPVRSCRDRGSARGNTSLFRRRCSLSKRLGVGNRSSWTWPIDTTCPPSTRRLATAITGCMRRNYAREAGDAIRIRDCRANVEQMTRQLARLSALVPGKTYPLPISIGISRRRDLGVRARRAVSSVSNLAPPRFAPRPVVVATLSGDWQPGYIPPADSYGRGIYQEVIAATAPGRPRNAHRGGFAGSGGSPTLPRVLVKGLFFHSGYWAVIRANSWEMLARLMAGIGKETIVVESRLCTGQLPFRRSERRHCSIRQSFAVSVSAESFLRGCGAILCAIF